MKLRQRLRRKVVRLYRVTEMCNYSKGVEQKGFEKGVEKGIEQGIEQGIVALIKTCKSFGASFKDTVRRLAESFGFSEERSKSEVEKYWYSA
jgi:flagellar biosynthesis/type III secretory pathway protein FliH